MADINVPLLVALGDRAAPQHKVHGQEAFEFSEGSDGALHTKIVDQNGNPISSSNKLQVADTDVKAELEQIKQQQQQILQRLDDTFNTQLTGSSTAFEIIKDTVVHLEPEQELVSDYFDNTSGNFSNFFINLYRAGQNNWQITVEISYDKSGHWRRVVRREILTPLEGEFQTLKGFDLAPYYINFRLKNIGASISTFYNVVVTFTR